MAFILTLIHLVSIFELAKCNSDIFFKTLAEEEVVCQLNLKKILNKTNTIFLDIDQNTDPYLKDCIIKGCSADQSVLIITKADVNFPPFEYMNKHPNVVFTSKYADIKDLDHPILQKFLSSYWSLIYIIVTNDNQFIDCSDHSEETISFYKKILRFLEYLWHKHRIVNVVLATPNVCPAVHIVYDGKTNTNTDLFNRTTMLLNATHYTEIANALHKSGSKLSQGYPLRANIFYRFPTSVTECANVDEFVNKGLKQGEYCGIDGLIMHDIVQHFGFKLIMTEEFQKYGYVTEYGNVTGSLGGIVHGEFDISFNARFMVPYHDNIEFLHYISHDALCVLLKIPDIVPLWYYPLNVFDIYLWVYIICTLTAIGYLMWISAIVAGRLHNIRVLRWYSYIFNALTSGLFGFSIFVNGQLLILRAACFCVAIVLLAIFQGHINYMFTTLFRYDEIKTLDELCTSSKMIHTSPSIRPHIMSPKTERLVALNNHIRVSNRISNSDLLKDSNKAYVVRELDTTLEIIRNFTDNSGTPQLYMIKECLRSFYLSFISRPGFPFNDQIKKYIEVLMQSGLPQKYYAWTQHAFNLDGKSAIDGPQPRPFSASTMAENCIAFYILLCGYILSAAVFAVEMWRGKFNHYN